MSLSLEHVLGARKGAFSLFKHALSAAVEFLFLTVVIETLLPRSPLLISKHLTITSKLLTIIALDHYRHYCFSIHSRCRRLRRRGDRGEPAARGVTVPLRQLSLRGEELRSREISRQSLPRAILPGVAGATNELNSGINTYYKILMDGRYINKIKVHNVLNNYNIHYR